MSLSLLVDMTLGTLDGTMDMLSDGEFDDISEEGASEGESDIIKDGMFDNRSEGASEGVSDETLLGWLLSVTIRRRSTDSASITPTLFFS